MAHVNPIQIQKYLKGVDYPASKQALLEKAKSMGADENVCQSLEQLPDESFQTPADVSQAFGRLPDDVSGGGGRQGGDRQGRDKQARDQQDRDNQVRGQQDRDQKQAGRDDSRARKDETRGEGTQRSRYSGSNEFLIQAMQDSMAEIQICEMAVEKSENQDVKKFAQMMIDEHGKMGRELEQMATDKQLDIPRTIRREQEMTVDELSALNGRDFEQRWIQYNIDVHERDIKVFQHYAGEQDDRDIAAIAKKHGEALSRHLKAAHDLGKKLARA